MPVFLQLVKMPLEAEDLAKYFEVLKKEMKDDIKLAIHEEITNLNIPAVMVEQSKDKPNFYWDETIWKTVYKKKEWSGY